MNDPLLYLETLGCPKNQADSRQISAIFNQRGYVLSPDPQEAEVILLNTCGFIDEAKEESIHAILQLSNWKEKGRCRVLIVFGCMVQKYREEMEEFLPEADAYFGVNEEPALFAYIDRYTAQAYPIPATQAPTPEFMQANYFADSYYRALPPSYREEPAGYIKIAEGCSHPCTFCVIPQIKGGYRSRKPASICAEAADRAAKGLKELILVAQDTAAYGRDLSPASSLAELVTSLTAIEDLERIRILYCYPEGIDEALIQAMKHPKVCPYLDMPIQHIDDALLQQMGRPMDSRQIKRVIHRLREAVPDIALRTTCLLGFPGESAEAFQSLMDFLEAYRLERVGFFAFSPQPDTLAGQMPNQVPADEKERRLAVAQGKRDLLLRGRLDELVGRTLSILIDEKSGEDENLYYYEGRSVWDAPEIDAVVSFSSRHRLRPGQIVSVKITHSKDYILSGEIADESCQ
ncbi:MAG: 30S ribosomal protein S12 methylthiotransferase RimO [Clostridiales bacterium]|nr:30S ribosomal protein S12 methylthiotransferase RimO [Clostridiales bacterium]